MPFRAIVYGLVILVLAACEGSSGGGTSSEDARTPEASAFFLTGEDTIEVRGFGRMPLDHAELIAPDGTTQTALDRRNERVADDYVSRPTVGIGGGGGSRGAGVGVGLSFPILDDRPAGVWYRSRASFPILDMALYRVTWRDWRIRMRFQGADGPTRQVELPAPEPPIAPSGPPPSAAPPSRP
ncbi:hypothetical protein [Desertibaculum subflavum]|uniref:hypothetical protein n=1 Tax=Desertibaculum subflavum TaxID=2268458 RepID=UPI000E669D1E